MKIANENERNLITISIAIKILDEWYKTKEAPISPSGIISQYCH